MATIINTPGAAQTDDSASAAGWMVAIVVIVAALAIGFFAWARYYQAPANTSTPGANINVTLPSGSTPSDNTTNTNPSDTNTTPTNNP